MINLPNKCSVLPEKRIKYMPSSKAPVITKVQLAPEAIFCCNTFSQRKVTD